MGWKPEATDRITAVQQEGKVLWKLFPKQAGDPPQKRLKNSGGGGETCEASDKVRLRANPDQ